MVIVEDDMDVEHWLLDALGYEYFIAPIRSIGVKSDEDEVLVGLVLTCYTGWEVEVVLAAARPGLIGKEFLKRVGEIVWNELDCGRVTIQTSNPAVVGLVLGLGGHAEGLKKDATGPGEDAWLLGLLRDNWRWQEEDHG